MGREYDVAVITGASSGIGKELAVQLAKAGTKVGLIARRAEKLEEIAAEISEFGGVCSVAPADVTSEKELKGAIEKITTDLGDIDLLIANAGVSTGTSVENFRTDTVEHVYKINVFGVMYAISAVVPRMIERGKGHIVGVASVAGFRGFPVKSAYCGSKAALRVQLEGLRCELEPHGIHVSTICPGFIKSEMTDDIKVQMPFMLETDVAVKKMLTAIEQKKSLYIFPWQMEATVGVLRVLPTRVFTYFGSYMKKTNKKHSRKARGVDSHQDKAA